MGKHGGAEGVLFKGLCPMHGKYFGDFRIEFPADGALDAVFNRQIVTFLGLKIVAVVGI